MCLKSALHFNENEHNTIVMNICWIDELQLNEIIFSYSINHVDVWTPTESSRFSADSNSESSGATGG